jgi:hypothetical protein
MTFLLLQPAPGTRPIDAATVERLKQTAQADGAELLDGGGARLVFDDARDPATVRGHVEMAARMVLGAHWHTRYELLDGG